MGAKEEPINQLAANRMGHSVNVPTFSLWAFPLRDLMWMKGPINPTGREGGVKKKSIEIKRAYRS